MQFLPYSPDDSDRIESMLDNHIDFAPEVYSSAAKNEDTDYFRAAYADSCCCGINYVLKSDHDDLIAGFMEAKKKNTQNRVACWYITALFVANNDKAEENALAMVTAFQSSLCDSNEICINVNPKAKDIARFWSTHGFAPNPDRSIFSNADEQTLVAYWKRF